jgi:hypothetical protein
MPPSVRHDCADGAAALLLTIRQEGAVRPAPPSAPGRARGSRTPCGTSAPAASCPLRRPLPPAPTAPAAPHRRARAGSIACRRPRPAAGRPTTKLRLAIRAATSRPPRRASSRCTAGTGRGGPVAPASSVAQTSPAPRGGVGGGGPTRSRRGGAGRPDALPPAGEGGNGWMTGERVNSKCGPHARLTFNPCEARELSEVLVPAVIHD